MVARVGSPLYRWSPDGLPQLINVLTGEMCWWELIGSHARISAC
jgi:lipopolysaccharide/colanic/teichoic acid biosynthesis glycosyltransferase